MVDKEVEIYEPESKKMKTDYCSENSVSLPGIVSEITDINTTSLPIGFEPGMFKQEETDVHIITTDAETIIQTEPHSEDLQQDEFQQQQSQPPTQQKVLIFL